MGTLTPLNQGKSTFAREFYNGWARDNEYPYRLHVIFIDKDGHKHEFEVAKGDNLLDIAQANDLEMEGMAMLPHRFCTG